MPDLLTILLALCVLVILAFGLALQNQRRKVKAARRKFNELEGEEHRMFTFLHDLGLAIENDPSLSLLSRIIVDGIEKVVSARGGAIYFITPDGNYLTPSYLSERCPPLIGIPVEIRKKAERDPRALESHLRLSRVPLDEGILGH